MQKKKVLVFSVPFSGHLNPLKALIAAHSHSFDFHVAITGWTNILADLSDITCPTTLLARSELHETDPAFWTLPRAAELLDDCVALTKNVAPDLILYDFFSPEGRFVGETLGLPYWSSIPALMGPFTHQDHLAGKLAAPANVAALVSLREKTDVDAVRIEMISDGLHFPGLLNVIWSYPAVTPPDFMEGRAPAPYAFAGTLRSAPSPASGRVSTLVYLSLGTVVMNNLWRNRSDIQTGIREFIGALAELWREAPFEVVIATQGSHVLDEYPSNWTVRDRVDQVDLLRQADVFVTHGGSNSFHESIRAGVPMVLIPFFGDQPLVARRAEELGIGIAAVHHEEIDTRASKDFVNADLANTVDRAVRAILGDGRYRGRFAELPLSALDPGAMLGGTIRFGEGDLLYGTNAARKKYVEENGLQSEFAILKFRPFSEIAPHAKALPRIVDIYHDAILNYEFFAQDSHAGMEPYASRLAEYKEFLGGASDFATMCIKGLEFFTRFYTIHFILEDYDPAQNYVTTKEIEYVLAHRERLRDSVLFYKKIAGAWVLVEDEEVRKILQKTDASQ